ncbi:uncharacterized protein [Nicotiana sylvestris]|uniref:Uncharacterized protein LOC104244782 isoform X4 n=1 Tax=Nicotiana sylvestris TaxID=4096 RepID=A0A1U7Y617_NICSY|nr:PREDICTED: uncharacterized protein LOC104244782 isoform X4 [Nicotiana sylvestris]
MLGKLKKKYLKQLKSLIPCKVVIVAALLRSRRLSPILTIAPPTPDQLNSSCAKLLLMSYHRRISIDSQLNRSLMPTVTMNKYHKRNECIVLVKILYLLMIVYKDIHPTDIEFAIIQIPPVGIAVENSPTPTHSDKSTEDSDDFSPTPDLQCKKKHAAGVDPSSSAPHKMCKEQIIHPSNTETQSKIHLVGVSEIA